MKKLIEQMPKIELHCHLDGSIRPSTLKKMAEKMQISFPATQKEVDALLVAPEKTKNLMEYLEKFDYVIQLLQTKENLTLAALDVMEQAKEDHVAYIEIRFAPILHTQLGLSLEEVIFAVLTGLKKGEERFGVKANALLCGMRQNGNPEALQIANLAKQFEKEGVAGWDLAGNEADYPPNTFKEAITHAKNLGVPITLHAGECGCGKNVYDAALLGAKRIGHGVALKDTPEYIQYIKENNIVLEMAPTSNFQTKTVEHLADYPFKKFFDMGLKICLNTDNRTVSNTNLNKEYKKIQDWYHLTLDDFEKLNQNAVFGAFLKEDEKKELKEQIASGYKALKFIKNT